MENIDLKNSEWNFNINNEAEFVEFTGIPGLQCNVPNSKPFSYFNLFFDDLFKNIVTWINLRANSVINKGHSRYSNLNRWHDIDFDELKKCLGISIVMGYLKFPYSYDYNTKMFGIDRADQMISYYPIPRKSMRWYV